MQGCHRGDCEYADAPLDLAKQRACVSIAHTPQALPTTATTTVAGAVWTGSGVIANGMAESSSDEHADGFVCFAA